MPRRSWLAIARWCTNAGARVTVADSRKAPPQFGLLQQDLPGVQFISGTLDAALLQTSGASLVVKSPGLAPQPLAPLLAATRAAGIPLTGELGLFAQALLELQQTRGYRPQVLAITGTNGKTTVTALTGQLIARAKKTVAVAGNIGPTLLDTLTARLESNSLPEVWVIELSSFQLDGAQGFEPDAATVLNVTQDHLDWHGSMPAYIAAKANVFGKQTKMLLNRDDPLVMSMLPPVSQQGRIKDRQVRGYETFGGGMPTRPCDFGLEEANGMVWLVRALKSDGAHRKRADGAEELFFQRLLPTEALRIRGRHNAVNALAALALASSVGCSMAPLLFGLREYAGEPHRVESVAVVNGIEFFDDSKGTNVGATIAALAGLGAERKIVVIMGGDGKGQDFSPLAPPVSRFAKAVVLIGRDASLIRTALVATEVAMWEATTMHDAVALAYRQADEGDAVLMSPACASFDMFENYPHRAAVFREAVAAIAQKSILQSGNFA